MWTNRLSIAALTAVVLCTTGCNPVTLAYFLAGGPKDLTQPEFVLKTPEGRKEIRILVLASAKLDLSTDVIGVDQLLASEFIQAMQVNQGNDPDAKNKKLTFIPSGKVQKYISDHPNWHLKPPTEIGEEFEVDYVISMDISRMRLRKPGSAQLLQGHTDISVTAYDLNRKEETKLPFSKEFSSDFPRQFEKDIMDTPLPKFRKEFVRTAANELTWIFLPHPYEESRYRVDSAN